MENLPGYISLGLGFLATCAVLLVGWFSWKRRHPKEWYRGVGVIYVDGADDPWPGIEIAIDAMWFVAQEEYPDEASELMKFWIKVVPHDGVVSGFTVPTGKTRAGKQVNGTVDRTRLFGILCPRYIMVIRQLRGSSMHARDSALYHEVAEHYWPFTLRQGWNSTHDSVWHRLNNRMREVHES
jgi:hypothetical protein